MTEEHLKDLILYRIERARETFEEALLMHLLKNSLMK